MRKLTVLLICLFSINLYSTNECLEGLSEDEKFTFETWTSEIQDFAKKDSTFKSVNIEIEKEYVDFVIVIYNYDEIIANMERDGIIINGVFNEDAMNMLRIELINGNMPAKDLKIFKLIHKMNKEIKAVIKSDISDKKIEFVLLRHEDLKAIIDNSNKK
ncbi:MAG: hypothetical protein IJ270_05750 [Paludibacteraceae bacterium]|nr:hypothetical protein [Paludibacteraceae bacterium]